MRRNLILVTIRVNGSKIALTVDLALKKIINWKSCFRASQLTAHLFYLSFSTEIQAFQRSEISH